MLLVVHVLLGVVGRLLYQVEQVLLFLLVELVVLYLDLYQELLHHQVELADLDQEDLSQELSHRLVELVDLYQEGLYREL